MEVNTHLVQFVISEEHLHGRGKESHRQQNRKDQNANEVKSVHDGVSFVSIIRPDQLELPRRWGSFHLARQIGKS